MLGQPVFVVSGNKVPTVVGTPTMYIDVDSTSCLDPYQAAVSWTMLDPDNARYKCQLVSTVYNDAVILDDVGMGGTAFFSPALTVTPGAVIDYAHGGGGLTVGLDVRVQVCRRDTGLPVGGADSDIIIRNNVASPCY